MKVIISPARTMRTFATSFPITTPLYQSEADVLIEQLRQYNPWQLETMLNANEKLAFQSLLEFQSYGASVSGTPALFAYDGLVYKYIVPETLTDSAVTHSASVLRILSALYGVLRPQDGIQPYRLELQSKVRIDGKNLYAFWGDRLYQTLYQEGDCVVNLASEEYAKIIRKQLRAHDRWIDIVFVSPLRGKQRVATTMTKMARGQMVRYILEQQLTEPQALAGFTSNGFAFAPHLSHTNKMVFTQS